MKNDIETTSATQLKDLFEKLLRTALTSQIQVQVSFRINPSRLDFTSIEVAFFKDRDILVLDLYAFYSFKTNTVVLVKALELMKDKNKFEEIKLWRNNLKC